MCKTIKENSMERQNDGDGADKNTVYSWVLVHSNNRVREHNGNINPDWAVQIDAKRDDGTRQGTGLVSHVLPST